MDGMNVEFWQHEEFGGKRSFCHPDNVTSAQQSRDFLGLKKVSNTNSELGSWCLG